MKTWRQAAVAATVLALVGIHEMPARAADDISVEAIENATTALDHNAIADAYAKRAEEARQEAAKHRAMAKSYKGGPKYQKVMGTQGAGSLHCDRLVEHYELVAKEADALAAMHREMAKEAQ